MPGQAARQLKNGDRTLNQGRPEEATRAWLMASRAAAGDPRVQLEVARRLGQAGRLQELVEVLQRLLALRPKHHAARLQLGICLSALKRWAEVPAALEPLVAAVPGARDAHVVLADSYQELGRTEEARAGYLRALAVDRGFAPAWNNLGNLLRGEREYAGAVEAYRAALAAAPRQAITWRNLGLALSALNRSEEAAEALDRAVALEPSLANRWTRARILPVLYETSGQVDTWRGRYGRLLAETAAAFDPADRSATSAVWDAFHLHYQGRDDRELQAQLGQLIHRVTAAAWPQWHRPLAAPAAGDGRIRVGFASSMLRDHTITMLFGGWIRGLDRSRFEVFCYHTGRKVDDVGRGLAQVARWRHVPGGVEQAAAAIRRDDLHALIYPELGMDREALKLASLRLAPLQCVSWGHPVTTGLPNVDVFLSSEAMEPPGAQAHYTERLVSLPGLSVEVSPPAVAPVGDRAAFGLGEGELVCLVPQSLFKLLPQYDWIYAAIAAALPAARLVFLVNEVAASEGVRACFERRLARAFGERGLDWTARTRLLPGLSFEGFLGLNAVSDVFLDAPGWSGGRTTLEAVSLGLVPVTWPGGMMRQRHTAAILGELGMGAPVAGSAQEYVEIVRRLGEEPGWREAIQEKIQAGLPRVFGDQGCVRALEAFLEGAVE